MATPYESEGYGPETARARNVAEQQESHRNEPASIVARLRASLPQGTDTLGSFREGGVVPKTGAYKLEKGEQVMSADDTQDPQAATAAPQPDATTQAAPTSQGAPDDSNQPADSDDAVSGEPVSLQKAYSLLNERIAQLFDKSGVHRSFSIPYVKGQATHEHVASLGQKLPEVGGVTKNFLTTFHHSGGKGWGSEDGMTIAHPTDKLRNTEVTKENPEAIAALAAAKSFLTKVSSLIGDTPTVQTAKSQLAIVGKSQGQGMNLFDFGGALIALVSPPLQEVARRHHDTKSHGPNHARLSPPRS